MACAMRGPTGVVPPEKGMLTGVLRVGEETGSPVGGCKVSRFTADPGVLQALSSPADSKCDKSLLPSCLGTRCPYSPGELSDFKVSQFIRQLAAQTPVVQSPCWFHAVPIHQQMAPRLHQWA